MTMAAMSSGGWPRNTGWSYEATRYMVSSDYFNIHDEWRFDTEEAARKKRAELLATLDTRWEVRMRAVKSDRT